MTTGARPTAVPGGVSDYDRTLPFPLAGPEVAARFAALRERRPAADLGRVRDVVAVVSSSRGGSTLLAELLRRTPGLHTLPGEVNPHVAIARADAGDPGVLRAEIARDVGSPAAAVDDLDAFTAACAWQLTAQWPALPLAGPRLADRVRSALGDIGGVRPEAWADGGVEFTCRLVSRLRADHPEVDPFRYDLPAAALARHFPGLRPQEGPPEPVLVEMAPYRLFRPWAAPEAGELADRPLVVVTPRNAYRLDHLRGLFAPARLRVLHLTRNPAAAVNGLVDGWHHRGFFSGPVPGRLSVAGYSDAYPWGRHWWKFDLPPRWESVRAADLAEVAALQWRSAHAAVLEFVERTGTEHLRIRYEDLVGGPHARDRLAAELAGWLGVEPAALRRVVRAGSRPVMATSAPRRRRWASTADRIASALADPEVWAVVAALGYGVGEQEWA